MFENLKLYPGGFLGAIAVPQTEPLTSAQANRRLLNSNAVVDSNPITANAEVMGCWSLLTHGDPSCKTFEFEEMVLRAAKRAFGTSKISEWMAAQIASPAYSDYHRRWLEETAKFVLTGARRDYTYNVWYTLLGDPTAPQGPVSALLPTYFGPYGDYREMAVVEFLYAWLQRERGSRDLLESLFLLFGHR